MRVTQGLVATLSIILMLCMVHCKVSGNNVSTVLDSLFSGYDGRIRPNFGGKPVEVGITMYVLSVSEISEAKMDYTMQFYFRQFWTDERLRFESKDVGSEMISIRSDLVPKLWVPDTFFVNEKQAQKHGVPNENGFVRIHHSGAVTQSMRLSVTAICPMNLQYFPMDLQQCHLEIESFGYSMNDIRYKWKDGPNSVGISNDVALPQFSVLGYRQRSIEISLSTGNYSRLAVEILIARSVGAYQLQTYVPASSFVILSWVSFWINPTATTTRVLIGLINNLLIILLCIATNAYLPKISYVKALDVYLGTCLVFVFASLIEFVVVHYLLNNKKRNEEHAAMSAENDEEVAKPAESNRNKIISRLQPVIKKLKTTNIDFWSRISFPFLFICFNIIYWGNYRPSIKDAITGGDFIML